MASNQIIITKTNLRETSNRKRNKAISKVLAALRRDLPKVMKEVKDRITSISLVDHPSKAHRNLRASQTRDLNIFEISNHEIVSIFLNKIN